MLEKSLSTLQADPIDPLPAFGSDGQMKAWILVTTAVELSGCVADNEKLIVL